MKYYRTCQKQKASNSTTYTHDPSKAYEHHGVATLRYKF